MLFLLVNCFSLVKIPGRVKSATVNRLPAEIGDELVSCRNIGKPLYRHICGLFETFSGVGTLEGIIANLYAADVPVSINRQE